MQLNLVRAYIANEQYSDASTLLGTMPDTPEEIADWKTVLGMEIELAANSQAINDIDVVQLDEIAAKEYNRA